MSYDPSKVIPSTMTSKKDYGVKIAKTGYDVNYASDTELLYNSSFPVLAIVSILNNKSGWEEVSAGADGYVWTYNVKKMHNLGYSPMIIAMNSPLFADPSANYTTDLTWDNKYVYIKMTFYYESDFNTFMAGDKDIGEYIVFAVNIDIDIEYPYFDFAVNETNWGATTDYGMKYILDGDAKQLDLNSLGINPNIQSLMVSAVKVCTSLSKNTYVLKNLDFNNITPFCFNYFDDVWHIGHVSIQAPSGYLAYRDGDGGYYEIDGLNFADKTSLVLVRMPFIAPNVDNYSVNM